MSERHHKVGWYQECTDHPQPDEPTGPYDPNDSAWRAYGEWDDAHFYVGDEGVLTCEQNRIADACAECSERRCDRLETWEAFVVWHGAGAKRDDRGRFVKAS